MDTFDLHAAARHGTLANVPASALTADALTARNAAGNTPLHVAARSGHLREIPGSLLTMETLTVKNDAGYSDRKSVV